MPRTPWSDSDVFTLQELIDRLQDIVDQQPRLADKPVVLELRRGRNSHYIPVAKASSAQVGVKVHESSPTRMQDVANDHGVAGVISLIGYEANTTKYGGRG